MAAPCAEPCWPTHAPTHLSAAGLTASTPTTPLPARHAKAHLGGSCCSSSRILQVASPTRWRPKWSTTRCATLRVDTTKVVACRGAPFTCAVCLQLWVQVRVQVQTCERYTMCCATPQVETTKVVAYMGAPFTCAVRLQLWVQVLVRLWVQEV